LTTFKASSQIVAVDVVVTDSKDHPVRGLQKKDFAVAEDGKSQALRSFHEAGAADTTSAIAPEKEKAVPNIFSNDRQEMVSGSVNVILLDLLNTPTQDQQWARKSLMKFLSTTTKPKNSQFALCTLSTKTHLRMIQGFTPDEDTLLALVNTKKTEARAARWQTASSGTQNAIDNLSQLARGGPTAGFGGLFHALETDKAEERVTDTDSRIGVTSMPWHSWRDICQPFPAARTSSGFPVHSPFPSLPLQPTAIYPPTTVITATK
jgi:VWFA-related protein